MPLPATRRPAATVIVPAFNEERALPVVLEQLASLRDSLEVIVVDDGSTDRTAEVARAAGVRVVRLDRNQGKAGAVRAGLAAADADKVIVIDADATYPADAIPAMVGLLDQHDMVVGVRTQGREHIPALNRLGNAALRTAVHWFSGFRSADPLTGLYALRRAHLLAMRLESRGFGLEVEIGVKAARMGLRHVDHPISYGQRIGTSKLNPMRDGLLITWTLVRTLFGRPRLRALPGRSDVSAAPLAMAATVASIALLTLAGVSLAATGALATLVIFQPDVPLSLSPARAGVVALFAGLALWRIATHWGRPPPQRLLILGAAWAAGICALIVAITLVADRLQPRPLEPPLQAAALAVAIAATVLGGLATAGVVAAALEPRRMVDAGRTLRALIGDIAPRRWEAVAVVAILVLFALPVARFISLGQLLGFDESIYAATSRAFTLGTPNSAWSADRSPGISLLGIPFAAIESDAGLRSIGLLFGLGAVAAAWALGRAMGGSAVGLIGALLVAAVPPLQLNAGLFLTDVPSAAVFLMLVVLVWHQLELRPEPGSGLLWLAPLAAATFYLRYGSSVPILFLALTALLLWPMRLMRAWRLTLATATLFVVLLLPHLLWSVSLNGNPFGVMLSAQSLAAPAFLGEGLAYYLRAFASELAGVVGGGVLALGVLAIAIRFVLRRTLDRRARALALLVLPAIAQLILLGLVALPQARYVLLPIMLLLVASALALVDAAELVSIKWRQTLAAGLVAAIAISALGSAAVMIQLQAQVTPAAAHLVDAAKRIRTDAAGAECSLLGYPPPEYVWYSGCAAHHFGYPPVAGVERHLRGERRYLVLSARQTDREPAGEMRSAYLALAEPVPMAVIVNRLTREPEIQIYRMARGP